VSKCRKACFHLSETRLCCVPCLAPATNFQALHATFLYINDPFESKVPITTFDLAIGVKKGEPKLVEKLNAWISDNLKNGKLNAIYKKFHGSELPENMRS